MVEWFMHGLEPEKKKKEKRTWVLLQKLEIAALIIPLRFCWLVTLVLARVVFSSALYQNIFMISPPQLVLLLILIVSSILSFVWEESISFLGFSLRYVNLGAFSILLVRMEQHGIVTSCIGWYIYLLSLVQFRNFFFFVFFGGGGGRIQHPSK